MSKQRILLVVEERGHNPCTNKTHEFQKRELNDLTFCQKKKKKEEGERKKRERSPRASVGGTLRGRRAI